jgi:hypothetical protein
MYGGNYARIVMVWIRELLAISIMANGCRLLKKGLGSI